MSKRTFKNPSRTSDYEAYMQNYFKHKEICSGCGKERRDHVFVKEITDYVCKLFYRCDDGEISIIMI